MNKQLFVSLLLSFVAFCHQPALAIESETKAVPDFSIEKKDKSEEEMRLHAKFSGDKAKIEKAIDNTKNLISQSHGRPYLPELHLRLAELYIEKSRIIYFLRKIELGDPEGSAVKGLETNALKSKAVEIYQRIVIEFPDFAEIDKVHFFMAHEFRELNMLDSMVEQYTVILREHKQSPFLPEAHLLLGDYYFSVPNLVKAKKHYQAVLAYPKSSAIDIARYKLAWVHINNNDFGKAIILLEKSVQGSGKNLDVDTYNRVDIRLEALTDLTFSYSKHYKDKSPQEAIDYFSQYAWSRSVYTLVLEKLAYRYLIQKKWSHAAYIYRSLAKLQNDTKKLLLYVDHILTCVREMNSFEQADKDIAIIIKTLDTMRYSVHVPDDEKTKAMTEYELYARDITTRLHETSRSKNKLADYERAADAYKQYLAFFDSSPKFTEMQLNYAETLFLAQRYSESGKVYEKIAAGHNGLDKQKHLYSATFAYYSALKDRTKLNYYQIVQATSGLQETGELYSKLFPKSPQVANVQFNVAWVVYDEGRYKDAIKQFDEFIKHHPKGKPAELAVDLILESYKQLEDYEGLVKYGKSLQAYSGLSAKIKSHVMLVLTATESKIITNMAVASVNDWNSGKTDLLNYADANKDSTLGEKALNALFVAAKEKAELTTMQDAGYKLIKQYPKSEQGEPILKLLIDASLKTAQFRTLVEYLEVYATQYPNKPDAQEFLQQAAELRQMFMQYEQANRDYNQLLRLKGLATATKRQLILQLADNYQVQQQSDKAITLLEANRKYYNWLGKLAVDAKLANLYLIKGDLKKLKRPYKQVNKVYKSKIPKLASTKEAVAQMYFRVINNQYQQYIDTQLNGVINDALVASKNQQFQKLTEGYYAVLEYKVPRWSIQALYQLYKVNQEFASFLQNAPLPELEPEQIEEYKQIIAQNVQDYSNEALQFLEAGNELALKIKILEPEINQYLSEDNNNASQFEFSPKGTEIGIEAFKQEGLGAQHKYLYQHPKNLDKQLALVQSYYQLRDYGQSLTMVNNLLNSDFDLNSKVEATLYTLMGNAYLGLGKDTLAKESFQQALAVKKDFAVARINLAALYQHYGHIDDAQALIEGLSLSRDDVLVHSRARQVLAM